MLTNYATVAIVAYLLGSIPFGYLLVKIFRGEDIRHSGSGNIGATNVARSGAKGLGILTLALDALKGFAAVLLAKHYAQQLARGDGRNVLPVDFVAMLMAAAALAAVLGHIFPVWLKFKGGKGVATALGAFILLFPKGLVVSLIVFIIVASISRYVSLSSILAALALPLAAYFLDNDAQEPVYRDLGMGRHVDWAVMLPLCATCILVVAKHHQNIRRLLAGNENRLGSRKSAPVEKSS
jgi:glycerol-3-phosphate acyltransferase PlsY